MTKKAERKNVDYLQFPIGAIVRYTNTRTVQLLRLSPQMGTGLIRRPIRGKVRILSKKSLNRMTFLLNTTQVTFRSMLTINYLSPPATGRKAKDDLRYVVGWLRRRFKGQGLQYFWFAEFTKAGSIHFHVLLTVTANDGHRKAYAKYWTRISKQGYGSYTSIRNKRVYWVEQTIYDHNRHPDVWSNAKSEQGLKHYANMYAQKPYQKRVPNWFADIGRFWGCSPGVRESAEVSSIEPITESEVRSELTAGGNDLGEWDYLPRYIWDYPES